MSTEATAKLTLHDDGTFIRTAIIVTPGETTSIDVFDSEGRRVAQLNIAIGAESKAFLADVIDVDQQFQAKRAILIDDSRVHSYPTAGNLVGAHFER